MSCCRRYRFSRLSLCILELLCRVPSCAVSMRMCQGRWRCLFEVAFVVVDDFIHKEVVGHDFWGGVLPDCVGDTHSKMQRGFLIFEGGGLNGLRVRADFDIAKFENIASDGWTGEMTICTDWNGNGIVAEFLVAIFDL